VLRTLLAFGTRPEIIKLGPVYRALVANGNFAVETFWSAQHVELAAGLTELFGMPIHHKGADVNLRSTLTGKLGCILERVNELQLAERYDVILVQGDTSTAAAVAMAGFLSRVPVAHVEAGLRTTNLQSPWPEEFNRRVISLCTRVHFAPTKAAAQNLLSEGHSADSVIVTGNTGVDALLLTSSVLGRHYKPSSAELRALALDGRTNKKLILVTAHRRENFGGPMGNVLDALRSLSEDGDKCIVFPVHLNPNVQTLVFDRLGNRPNIHLISPLQYPDFVHLLSKAWAIVTDSGGVQEEAPTFGKPVIITRDSTERPEVIEAGFGHLVGCSTRRIVDTVRRLVAGRRPRRVNGSNPFGDGRASMRIVEALAQLRPTSSEQSVPTGTLRPLREWRAEIRQTSRRSPAKPLDVLGELKKRATIGAGQAVRELEVKEGSARDRSVDAEATDVG
jgi:UDP-N-acetylglucosamine 2-epimerase